MSMDLLMRVKELFRRTDGYRVELDDIKARLEKLESAPPVEPQPAQPRPQLTARR